MALLFDKLPEGFLYQPGFVTPEEEAALVREIEAMEFSDVRMRGVTARRREGVSVLDYLSNAEIDEEGTVKLARLAFQLAPVRAGRVRRPTAAGA